VQYYVRKQATSYIRERGIPIGDNFLAQAASDGSGPPFRYSGRHPIYIEDDLNVWIEERLSTPVRSPAERQLQLSQLRDAQQNFDPPLTSPTRTTRRRPGRPRKQPTAPAPPA
jgi:hypothetical protein